MGLVFEKLAFRRPTPVPKSPRSKTRATAQRAADEEGSRRQKLSTLAHVAEDFASASRADSTLDTYVKHWNAFREWCTEHDFSSLPASAQTLVFFLGLRARKRQCGQPR